MTNIPLSGIFRVTCPFKKRGKLWSAGWHTGIDLVVDEEDDDTIYASCDGEIVDISYDNAYGHHTVIRADDGYYHWYCHLRHTYQNVGDRVDRNTVIGLMGDSGNATGKHLHYEIREPDNVYAHVIDPANYMGILNVVGYFYAQNYPVYRAHVQDIGWQDFVSPFKEAGTTGQSLRIEAIQIMSDDIEYRVHLQDKGWTDWQKGGTTAGTTGESRRLEAIEFRSARPMLAQGHVQDEDWQNVQSGFQIMIGTTGQSKRLECFRFGFVT